MYAFEPLKQSLDVISKGGSIGVFSGSLDRISEDCQILRPTIFGATPAVWNNFRILYDDLVARISEKYPNLRKFDLEEKISEKWEQRNVLGNRHVEMRQRVLTHRCRQAIIGGAKASDELKKWIFVAMKCVVTDGYGTTETGGLAGNTSVHSGANLQLVDCPALGYFTSDKPNPRGEIIAHTSRLTPGYYNDKEATNERVSLL